MCKNNSILSKACFCCCLFFLSACSLKPDSKYTKNNYGALETPGSYIIKKGDTLFSIAWRYGIGQEQIQTLNNISNPNKIFVGQKLILQQRTAKGPARKSKTKTNQSRSIAKKTIAPEKGPWVWPIKGKVIRQFNPKKIGANGIRISGTPNQTINAASGGIVAYKGNGLNGYGNVVIIKQRNGLLSAYGFLSKTFVKEGQSIKKRQKIGTVGYASNNKLMLHFEIRKKGKPVNPLTYIGRRYHF